MLIDIASCIDCKDNKISCKTCKNSYGCKGCTVCNTFAYQMCPHCDIDCDDELSCSIRNEWIKSTQIAAYNISGYDKGKETVSEFCDICPWEHACAFSKDGMCPGEQVNGRFKSLCETPTFDEFRTFNVDTSEKGTYAVDDDVWDSKISYIKECPHIKPVHIDISSDVYFKLRHLQEMFSDVEFTVYANAVLKEDGSYHISDIVIPKQKVGTASVDDIIVDGNYNTAIHKHPGAAPGGFSGIDDEYINSNHDFSLLIGSTDLKTVVGVGRIMTTCKKYMRVPVEVNFTVVPITDAFFLESTKNIEKTVEKKLYTSYHRKNSINDTEAEKKEIYCHQYRWY